VPVTCYQLSIIPFDLIMVHFSALVVLLSTLSLAHAHGLILSSTGSNGVTGPGMGLIDGTPRDCSSPGCGAEADTPVFKKSAGVCGATTKGGNVDVAANVASSSAAGLPAAAADGSVTMTLHQVNQDGAGPYKCQVSADATGNDFVAMTMTTQIPGVLGLSGKKATDLPMVATIPVGTTCTGGPNGDACLVQCKNQALAGPFGGCVAITNAGSNSTAAGGNSTAATSAKTKRYIGSRIASSGAAWI